MYSDGYPAYRLRTPHTRSTSNRDECTYNDQVRAIGDRLNSSERTRGVPVGTVDKFQGREAAVVFFSMATSSGDEMTRGGLLVLTQSAQRCSQSRQVSCIPRLHRCAARYSGPDSRGHEADRDIECVRGAGKTVTRARVATRRSAMDDYARSRP